MFNLIIFSFILLLLLTNADSFSNCGSLASPKKSDITNIGKLNPIPVNKLTSITSPLSASPEAISIVARNLASFSASELLAKALGYVLAFGSMSVYTPILFRILKQRSADGLSTQTWFFNLLGLTLSAMYPYQRGFPISSYIELLILSSQSLVILCLACHFKKQDRNLLLGAIPFLAYLTLITKVTVPPRILQSIQIISTLLCNYANIPQILLTYREKRSAWSRTTALMSVTGNLIRKTYCTINT